MASRARTQVTPEMVERLTPYVGVGAKASNLKDIVADLQGVVDALESVSPARLRDVEPQFVAPLPTPQRGGAR